MNLEPLILLWLFVSGKFASTAPSSQPAWPTPLSPPPPIPPPPARPQPPGAKKKPQPTAKPKAKSLLDQAKQRAAAAAKKKAVSMIPGASASVSTPKPATREGATDAAWKLYDYVKTNAGPLGTRGAPSAAMKSFQQQMGGLNADGIYGPKTRARAKALGAPDPGTRGGVSGDVYIP